jgi:hypothetical protein
MPGRVPERVGALGRLRLERERALGDAVVALAVVVALSVNAAAQARLCDHLLVELAPLAQLELRLELIDLLRPARIHPIGEGFLPRRLEMRFTGHGGLPSRPRGGEVEIGFGGVPA